MRRVTSRALSGEEDQRSIDDWMSSEMDARIQHTIDGVKSKLGFVDAHCKLCGFVMV